MIRHSPAEVYIKFLIAHPDGYETETIMDMLRLKQLDFIGPSYIERLRLELHPPPHFQPENKLHRPSSRFITKHRLFYLFHPDLPMEEAYEILEDPKSKEAVETMLITDEAPALIAHRTRSFGVQCTLQSIERYRFFFFNTDLVDDTELRTLLRLRTDFVDPNSDDYDDQVRMAMKKVGFRDPRRIAADHPMRSMSAIMNMMRMGFMPNSVELSRLASSVRVMCLTQAAGTAMIGGPGSAGETRDFIIAANGVSELLNNVGSPDTELQKELQMLALKTDDASPRHIAELPEGSHTVDVQPLAEREASDVE